MSNLSTLPKGDSAWLLRKAIERIMQQVSVLETNIGESTSGNSADTQIIFNDDGTLRGDAGLVYNKTTDALTVTGLVTAGSATITGDLTVRTNVLKVNTTTNRVGINTTTPTQNLQITGSGDPLTADGCSAVKLTNTVSGRAAIVGIDDSQNFVIWNVGTEVSETIKFLTGGGSGKEQYRITHGGVFTWYDGAGGTRMTLNSTGLGVGDAPSADCKLTVKGGAFINRGASGGASQLLVSLAASSGSNFGQISNTGTRWALGYGPTLTTVGTEALIWDSSGNVGIGVTPSAGKGCLQLSSGINFPATQVASSDANTLDDYEEGTFTPTVSSVGGTGIVYVAGVSDAGKYTKIGNLVRFTVNLSGTYTGTFSYLRITLPFTVGTTTDAVSGYDNGTGLGLAGRTDVASARFIVYIPQGSGSLGVYTGSFNA